MIPHSKAATVAVLLGLLLWVSDAAAETFVFKEHNFSIELPTGWVKMTAVSKDAILTAKSPDHKIAVSITIHSSPIDAKSWARSMSVEVTVEPITSETIAGQEFTVIRAHNDQTKEVIYATTMGQGTLAFDFVSINDSLDPVVAAIVHSFKFLPDGGSPVPK